jgi:cyclopropane fatty-acyl-phospholipid synthase-like methyltransferase
VPIEPLNEGMDWLIKKGDKVLDFGCGNGTLLLYAALKGAEKCVGIDLSSEGIKNAKARSTLMHGEYVFLQGGIDSLESLEQNTFDAVILSNIIDNLTEEDMRLVLLNVHQCLKKDGRLLVKLNDYIHPDSYETYGLTIIDGDLLDSGLYLLNKTSLAWKALFKKGFKVIKEVKISMQNGAFYNRLFLLEKEENYSDSKEII